MWDDPRLRVESKVDGILILHFLEAIGKLTLFCNSAHSWEVVNLLIFEEGIEYGFFDGAD